MLVIRILTGTIELDHTVCSTCKDQVCVKVCPTQVFRLDNMLPVAAMAADKIKNGGCTECLACEQECHWHAGGGLTIRLPIPIYDVTR